MFGRLDQKTSSITTRVNYTVTPNLSVQVYAQPFVSSGLYGHFKELVNGRAADYDDRYAPYRYAGSPDFKVLSFRTTNVMRWEYKPGSTLFVVWQQGREGSGRRTASATARTSATSSRRPRPTRSSSSSPTGSIRKSRRSGFSRTLGRSVRLQADRLYSD